MIDQGMAAFITSYHKGFSASQSQKCVHLLKYSRLERVAFQLYTLRGKYAPNQYKAANRVGFWL
jgi:hypothetical protein